MKTFTPAFAIDCGAYRGDWTRVFKGVHPDAEVLMVEPLESQAEALRAVCNSLPGVHYSNALLGAESGAQVTFEEMATGSSVYHERSPYPRRLTSRITTKLDDIMGNRKADFIKLDVQGYELEVLRGAKLTMRSVQAALIETNLVPTNCGVPLFHEMVGYMHEIGFRVSDIGNLHRRADGVLWQADLFFVREGSGLLPSPELTAENWGSVEEVTANMAEVA